MSEAVPSAEEPNGDESHADDELTLYPPGRIAVIGAGPIGVECALYGRYLGYDVIVVESDAIGGSLRALDDQSLPMMPDRCLSPLAIAAIEAQKETAGPSVLPLTVGEWIEQGLKSVAESDLLAGRFRMPSRCVSIELAPLQASEDDDGDGNDGEPIDEIPPDFLLTLRDIDGSISAETVEAVILATGKRDDDIHIKFPTPAPYLFQLTGQCSGDLEKDLHDGWRQIVTTYASLMGRAALDLYRPRRV